MNEDRIQELIGSLGSPTPGNEYILNPDENGKWWITHKAVGSGELLEDFLREGLWE